MRHVRPSFLMQVACALLLLPALPAAAVDPGLRCERGASQALESCVRFAANAAKACFAATGTGCDASDARLQRALDRADALVSRRCPDDAAVQAAGFGPTFTQAGLLERVAEFCQAEVAALAARSFGGPQGAAWAEPGGDPRCLEVSFSEGARAMVRVASHQARCIQQERRGRACDVERMENRIAQTESRARTRIANACQSAPLASQIGIDESLFVERASSQARCLTATGHSDSSPLSLDCGPRADLPGFPRGSYVQVVLDEAEWGTRCGDGSPYAFWLRLAPSGAPVENVVVAMQGGGVCLFENDCATRSPDLFEALSDPPPTQGTMSNDPGVSPLADFTKVYLPFCTQDVFAGAGATSDFPSVSVARYGALNVRAALRYVRDVIWRELDQTTPEGYTPDRMRVFFGGYSAGAFGTLYNYHYLLDDLQWSRTTAFPDAGLSLDNGELLGVANLGLLVFPATPPFGWNAQVIVPPYCSEANCSVGPILVEATSERLVPEAFPEQCMMILSNQNDTTQVNTTFFPDTPTWVNAMRQSYCDTRDLPGIDYFLPPISSSIHVISASDALFTGLSVDGQLMNDWIEQGLVDPLGVVDRVQEGGLTTDIPGVQPFPCAVAP